MEMWGNDVALFGPVLMVDMLYIHVCYLLLLFKSWWPHTTAQKPEDCVLPKGLYLPEPS